MQIEYRSGDLIDAPEHLIVQGCNAQGVMASGIAKAIKERLPFAYRAYREVYLSSVEGLALGDVIFAINVGEGRPRIVANAITQENYGNDGKVYVSYESIEKAVRRVDRLVAQTQSGDLSIAVIGQIDAVGFPRIGAGLGGGDWDRIAAIIENESVHFRPIVYQL